MTQGKGGETRTDETETKGSDKINDNDAAMNVVTLANKSNQIHACTAYRTPRQTTTTTRTKPNTKRQTRTSLKNEATQKS